MSGLPYYNRYARDALDGMRRLNPEQRGVYNTLLDLMYSSGVELDDDDLWLARENNCTPRTYRRIKAELIALGKIWVVDGKIGNGRATDELAKQMQARAQRAEGGRRGADARWTGGAQAVEKAPAPEPQERRSADDRPDQSPIATPIAPVSPAFESRSKSTPAKGHNKSLMARPSRGHSLPEPESEPERDKPSGTETPTPAPASPVTGAGAGAVAGRPKPSRAEHAAERLRRHAEARAQAEAALAHVPVPQ